MGLELVDNPQALASLYDAIPPANPFDLFRIALDREGTMLRIEGDLPTFPAKPAKRWPRTANRVHIELQALDIDYFSLEGWLTTMRGELELSPTTDRRIAIRFTSDEVTLRCVALVIRVERVEGYVCEEEGH